MKVFVGARIGKTLLDIHRNNISIFPIDNRRKTGGLFYVEVAGELARLLD